jgi:lysozyme family protein
MNLFEKCMDVVFAHEGGFQRHPEDSGNWVGGYKTGTLVGTNYGIAAKYFPDVDIRNLTKEGARQIYYKSFWLPMNLGGIQDPLAILHIFDMGVNAGKSRSIKMAQKIVKVEQDGKVGPITTAAINDMPGFTDRFIKARISYYKNLVKRKKAYQVFLNGWLRRVDTTNFIR